MFHSIVLHTVKIHSPLRATRSGAGHNLANFVPFTTWQRGGCPLGMYEVLTCRQKVFLSSLFLVSDPYATLKFPWDTSIVQVAIWMGIYGLKSRFLFCTQVGITHRLHNQLPKLHLVTCLCFFCYNTSKYLYRPHDLNLGVNHYLYYPYTSSLT